MVDDHDHDRVEEHDLRIQDADYGREYDDWIDEITRKPWFAALEDLTGEDGFWVGTEDGLMAELRARAGDTGPEEDFPSGVGQLLERPTRDVEYAFRKARLDVVDYRKLEEYDRVLYDVPGWGRKAPILVRRGMACFGPSHEGAIERLICYGNPLAISIVLFTNSDKKFKGKDREWSGRTTELAERLSRQRVNMLGHPERSREVQEILKLERPGDFRRFSGMMRTSAYVLEEVDVRVSWERVSGRNPISGEDYTYTRWTIEAPNWVPWRPRRR